MSDTPGGPNQPSETLTDAALADALTALGIPPVQIQTIIRDRRQSVYVMLINVLLAPPIAPPDLAAIAADALPH